jgi:predicted amidohydrolase YtcJ
MRSLRLGMALAAMLPAQALPAVIGAVAQQATAATSASGPSAWPAGAPAPAARLLLRGGRVHAADGSIAEALAVDARGLIIAVGRSADLERLRTAGTRVVDLAGHAVLPGLDDQHVHPLFAGLRAHECVIPQGSTRATLQERLRACVAAAPRGAWITGGQWDAPALGGVPDRALLDAVAPENPVVLDDTSGHSALANTRALAAAGITRATPDPPGGIIERDGAGMPTGVLREDVAINLVKSKVPPPSAEAVRTALQWSLQEMLSQGVTSFTEAAVGFPAGPDKELAAYMALADGGMLKQRVRLCLTWEPGNESSEQLIARRNFYARERISPDCVKIFLDGVPTDSHTAAMLEPYGSKMAGRDDPASRNGLLLVRPEVLNAAVTRFDRMGLTVKFHAAGDAAVRAGLDAIEAARHANGFSGHLHDVGHCTFVARQDVSRARGLAATFEVSPYLWGPSPINDSITAAVADARMDRVWPVREMLDAGAAVVAGSDWAVVPSVNPWIAIEQLVTRERPGGSSDAFGRGEAITLPEAIALFTTNAARHLGHEGSLGAIAPGMLADLIVLDQDPYAVPVRDVHRTRVLMTIIGGEVVFERHD